MQTWTLVAQSCKDHQWNYFLLFQLVHPVWYTPETYLMFLSPLQNINCCVSLYRGAGAGRLWPNPNNGNTVRYFSSCYREWISDDIWQTWLINKLLASQIPYSSSSPGTYVVTERFFLLLLWYCLSWRLQSRLSCFHRVLQEEQEAVDVLREHPSCQVQQVMAYLIHISVYCQHHCPFKTQMLPGHVMWEQFHGHFPLCVDRLH